MDYYNFKLRTVGSNSEAYSDFREQVVAEKVAGIAMTRCVAVCGRLRCAHRPYMMWLIVTSPSSPALLPLSVIKSGRREQNGSADCALRTRFGWGYEGVGIGTNHSLSLGRGLG